MTEHVIKCPCCQNEITLYIAPGERWMGQIAHPSIEELLGCDCYETLDLIDGRIGVGNLHLHPTEWYKQVCFERAGILV